MANTYISDWGGLKDNRGATLRVGQKVVFNWSGQLAYGIIEDIQHKGYHYNGSKKYLFFIRGIAPHTDISKVTKAQNIMMIKEIV